MQLPALTAMLLSSALANTPSPASAPAPSTEVELEVVEGRGRSASTFAFVVPVEGRVEAWIERDGSPHRCQLEAQETRGGSLRVHLRCEGSPQHAIELEATRRLAPGKRTRLVEVRRPGRADHQVFATLH